MNSIKVLIYKGFFVGLVLILTFCSESKNNNKGGVVESPSDSISVYVVKELGATLKTQSGLTLFIPENALPESMFITMNEYSNEASQSSTIDLQPNGAMFTKPLSLSIPVPKGLQEELVEAYLFSEEGEALSGRDESPIVEPLQYQIVDRILSAEVSHFSQVVVFGAQALHLVFQLPSQALLPGDIEYNLNSNNRWMTGHARVFLGFDVESSPKEATLTTGTQEFLSEEQRVDNQDNIILVIQQSDFYARDKFIHATSANQSGVYIDDDATFRDSRSQWLYFGAKRRNEMFWQNQVALANFLIGEEGSDYSAIGLNGLESENTYTSTSLVEEAFWSIAFGLGTYDNINSVEEVNLDASELNEESRAIYNSPLPVQQYTATNLSDINEITLYEGETDSLIIPIYGALRVAIEGGYAYEAVKVEATVDPGNEDLLSNFNSVTGNLDLSFLYQKVDETPWVIHFTLEEDFAGETVTVERDLTIHLNDARPIFQDDFTDDELKDEWTSDESQIIGSDGVELNFLPSILSIKTPIPSTGCDSHFLWTEQLDVSGSFSVEYQFLKNGDGNSALLISTDGVKDGSANDNILEFYISTDTAKLGVNNRVAGSSSSLYDVDDEDYVGIPLNFKVDRVDDLFHFYINNDKVPLTFSNTALDTASSIVLGIETSSCSLGDGHGVDLVDSIEITNDATLGFEGLMLSYSEIDYISDHDQHCVDEFGPLWQMADWTDLETFFDSEADMDLLALNTGFLTRNNAWVLYDGDPSYSLTKDYFVAYHNRDKPESFADYDEIDDNFFTLGASLTNKYVLCKKP